jgi:hypothetical protein
MKSNRSKEIRTYDKEFWWYFAGFCGLVVLISWLPLILTQYSWGISIGTSAPNEIGDSIGGTLGPFVALLASALTFLAFWVQYKANQQQRHDIKVERFENKFYEMLRLHRANVDEMNIADRVTGRKCFIQYFYEFSNCYKIVEDMVKVGIRAGANYNTIDLLDFAYSIFFFGVGINSEKLYRKNFTPEQEALFIDCKKQMEDLAERYRTARRNDKESRYFTFDLPLTFVVDERSKLFYYEPFNGHADRLGHYYRHLLKTVTYVTEQSEHFLDEEQKREYVKMFRAQLSNFEQLMLYYNSMAWFREEWHELFTDYALIKNLPIGLADFGVLPLERYKNDMQRLKNKGINMFENV